jgi:predicted GNAT family acetyltransferase
VTKALHPLDNPIWHALTTTHAGFAVGGELARRYPLEVAPFAALADASSRAFAGLAEVLRVQRMAATFTATPLELPDGWQVIQRQVISQMVCEILEPVPELELEVLDKADVPEMTTLVELTKPGPFKRLTIRMGAYYGLRGDGTLIAMAGERLRLEGFTEISAVCTHPDHQGRGYGKALVQRVCQGVFARGELPFLHVKTDNANAVRAYEKLGFVERRSIHLTVLRLAEP